MGHLADNEYLFERQRFDSDQAQANCEGDWLTGFGQSTSVQSPSIQQEGDIDGRIKREDSQTYLDGEKDDSGFKFLNKGNGVFIVADQILALIKEAQASVRSGGNNLPAARKEETMEAKDT